MPPSTIPPALAASIRAGGLDPDEPLVRLLVAVVDQAPADYQAAYRSLIDSAWLYEAAEIVATDEQVQVATEKWPQAHDPMRLWASAAAQILQDNPLAVSILLRLRAGTEAKKS